MRATEKRDIITVWMEINRAELARATRVLGKGLLANFEDEVSDEIAAFGERLRVILDKYEARQERIMGAPVVRIDRA